MKKYTFQKDGSAFELRCYSRPERPGFDPVAEFFRDGQLVMIYTDAKTWEANFTNHFDHGFDEKLPFYKEWSVTEASGR